MTPDINKLEKKLDVKFVNQNLLKQAMVHRSYLNEHPDFGLPDNERLEFLGDAVIELAVTEHLYNNYPNDEGDLTSWRAALVNAEQLSEIAKKIGLNDFLLLSRGEAKDKGKARDFILANALEAAVGAIYLDQGFKKSAEFIRSNVIIKLPEIIEQKLYYDPKSRLQEKSQDIYGVTPRYEILEESGPDHQKKFKVGVYFSEELVGEGEGFSKQEAQQEAAKDAMGQKSWDND